MVPAQTPSTATEAERLAARAAAILRRPGAWLDVATDGYGVRLVSDRRRRPVLRIDEAAFHVLVEAPGLKPREAGGWALRASPSRAAAAPSPGRPGVVLGERAVREADGRIETRTVNLAENPVAWLARRRDAQGRPWLTPAEAASAERLRADFERAGTLGRLTMRWDGQPRGGGGERLEPAERARAAKDRLHKALEAVGPGLREMLERICLTGLALEAAERDLGLPRRSGKTLLKLALQRLAAHYRIG